MIFGSSESYFCNVVQRFLVVFLKGSVLSLLRFLYLAPNVYLLNILRCINTFIIIYILPSFQQILFLSNLLFGLIVSLSVCFSIRCFKARKGFCCETMLEFSKINSQLAVKIKCRFHKETTKFGFFPFSYFCLNS